MVIVENYNEKLSIPIEIDEIIQRCVENLVQRERFVTYNVDKRPVSSKGSGYMAVSYEVDVKGTTADGEKEINIFFKHILPVCSFDDFFSITQAYLNECFIYKDLSKIIEKLQEEANVPTKKRYNIIKSYEESSSKVIILDNLYKLGYKMQDRMKIPSLSFVQLAIEQLAKFHALGLVIQKKMPKYFEKNILTKNYLFRFNEKWRAMGKNMTRITTKGLDEERKKKCQKFIPRHLREFGNYYLINKDKGFLNTLCHNDYRICNLFVKEKNEKITKVVPIDYQLISYGCPVNDLYFFIYSCTDKKFRSQHLKNLFDFYYSTLKEYLKYFDIDIEEMYSKEKFDETIKDRAAYALMVTLHFFPPFFASETDAPDVANDISQLDFNLDESIMLRVQEIVDEFEQLGVL